jgi:hypothetical protein
MKDLYHLLTGFPMLFPYGMGAPYDKTSDVPFKSQCMWFMLYADGHFLDKMFITFLFDIYRRCQAHQTKPLYQPISMPVFNDQQKQDILQAILICAALQNEHISGSDKCRCLLSHCVWAMTTIMGPPSLTLTMHPPSPFPIPSLCLQSCDSTNSSTPY